jgi:hypothetical protein
VVPPLLSPRLPAKLPPNYIFTIDYHGIGFRSRKNPPFGPTSERVASHTSVSTASSGERGAPEPPMSVLTQPGHMALTFTSPRTARDTFTVKAFRAALETA